MCGDHLDSKKKAGAAGRFTRLHQTTQDRLTSHSKRQIDGAESFGGRFSAGRELGRQDIFRFSQRVFYTIFSESPDFTDGERMTYCTESKRSEVWLIDQFDAPFFKKATNRSTLLILPSL
jgi:hypothetical protein